MSAAKLSPTQRATLVRMAEGDGSETPPGGYRDAGRDASRWWRTMQILADKGLVTRVDGRGGMFKLAPAAKSVLQEGGAS